MKKKALEFYLINRITECLQNVKSCSPNSVQGEKEMQNAMIMLDVIRMMNTEPESYVPSDRDLELPFN